MDTPKRGRDPEPTRSVTPWQARILDRIARLLRLRPKERQELFLKELQDAEEEDSNCDRDT